MRLSKRPVCSPPCIIVRTMLSCGGAACLVLGIASIGWVSDRVIASGAANLFFVPMGLVLAGVVLLGAAFSAEW